MLKVVLILAVATLAVFGTYYYQTKNINAPAVKTQNQIAIKPSASATATPSAKLFQSKHLKFSIQIPSSAAVQDNQTYTKVNLDGSTIDILKNGTNTNSLVNYLNDPNYKTNTTISNSNKLSINGYESINRIETNNSTKLTEKVYYINVNNFVYILSTNSKVLYQSLDQIAQSFKYTP